MAQRYQKNPVRHQVQRHTGTEHHLLHSHVFTLCIHCLHCRTFIEPRVNITSSVVEWKCGWQHLQTQQCSAVLPPLDFFLLCCQAVVVGYLTLVLCQWVVHLPAIHRKHLLVLEGKQRLEEERRGRKIATGE